MHLLEKALPEASPRLHARLAEDLLALSGPPDQHVGMDIDRFGPRPVFAQIAGQLMADLRTNFAPGQRLPCETELAERFSVNRHTLRHAIDVLVADGWLERRRGLGTFVLDRPIEYPLSERTRFTSTLKDLGLTADIKVLRTGTEPADEDAAERLQIGVGDTIFRIETLRCVDGIPVTVITHRLAAHLLPDFLTNHQGQSLEKTVLEHYGFVLRRHFTLIGAIMPTSDDAALLMAPRSLPLMRIRTVNIDAGSRRPIEYSVARTRSDRIELRIDHTQIDEEKSS